MGWNDGPPTWSEMERVLSGRPKPAAEGDGGDSPAWSRKRDVYDRTIDKPVLSTTPYAELHAHSAFSFLDGASQPEEMVEEAVRLGLESIAITDHDGFYGVVRFAEAARALGIGTVFGAELSLDTHRSRAGRPIPTALIYWCSLAARRGIAGSRVGSRPHTWPAESKASRSTTSTNSPNRRAGTGRFSPVAERVMFGRRSRAVVGGGRVRAAHSRRPLRGRSRHRRTHPARNCRRRRAQRCAGDAGSKVRSSDDRDHGRALRQSAQQEIGHGDGRCARSEQFGRGCRLVGTDRRRTSTVRSGDGGTVRALSGRGARCRRARS